MLGDIFSAISLGRKLIETISDLRRDIRSARSGSAGNEAHAGKLEAFETRLGDIESQAKEQSTRGAALQQSLNDTLRATEALAERVSTIFWIASIACGLALVGLIVAAVALARTVR